MLVKFRCPRCKMEGEVEVRDRRPEEPFDYWARRVAGRAVLAKHAGVSLLCEETDFDAEFTIKDRPDDPRRPSGYVDIADFSEDQRINLIGQTLMRHPPGFIVAVCTDDEPGKAERYERKLITAFPTVEVVDRFPGPVEGTVTLKVQRKA